MFRSRTQEPKIPLLDKPFGALDAKTHKSLTFKYLVRLEGIPQRKRIYLPCRRRK